jgi:hypothetical protein
MFFTVFRIFPGTMNVVQRCLALSTPRAFASESAPSCEIHAGVGDPSYSHHSSITNHFSLSSMAAWDEGAESDAAWA